MNVSELSHVTEHVWASPETSLERQVKEGLNGQSHFRLVNGEFMGGRDCREPTVGVRIASGANNPFVGRG